MQFQAKRLFNLSLWVFLLTLLAAYLVGSRVAPTWEVDQVLVEVEWTAEGNFYLELDGEKQLLERPEAFEDSQLNADTLNQLAAEGRSPEKTEQYVVAQIADGSGDFIEKVYRLQASRHWKLWSFLPALVAIVLCWITKEPILSLFAGIVVGAALIGVPDVLSGILIPSIGTKSAATILILYLWLLGGLMGVWEKTGASRAFADAMSTHFVRGPRTAKLVAWMLGVIFFQGGTVSAVLVGTTVKPLADKERVSHEELSLIVDATSSPIAVLLAFNAWPLYVQAFMGVAGVSYLATEADRVAFFFRSIPLSFYAIGSVLLTFLLSIDKLPWTPLKLRQARHRARTTGQLDAADAEPLAMTHVQTSAEKKLEQQQGVGDHSSHVLDFLLPLAALLSVAIGTYLAYGSPQVLWAFAVALTLAALLGWYRGMPLRQVVLAMIEGQKSVVLGSFILLLAITIGNLSQEVGGGRYLVSMLGNLQAYWALPALAFLMAVVISFSTGTSWATFAVTLPLVMPLAHAIAMNQGLAHSELYLSINFIACLNGAVFGDQCSPISDTTILSSMCTGADLMDHVTTQIPVAMQAAVLAVIGWTVLVLVAV
jgi:Na+/H+ antiporter NhaC